MGKGMSLPSSGASDIFHALTLRLKEEEISANTAQRERFRTDVAPVEPVFRNLFSRLPDVVVRPDSAKTVADVLDSCLEERTSATPIGGGTAGLGGGTPVRGGVILDLSALGKVLSVDRQQKRVTVEAGCTWKSLETEIDKEGLGLCCYPSSALVSTVAGWMSTGGYGVGTLSSGRFHRQVDAVEVAVPSGILVTAGMGEGRYSVRSLAGTEGQMGIITKITLPVKPRPERRTIYVLRSERMERLFGMAGAVSRLEQPPFWMVLVNEPWLRLGVDVDIGAGGKALGVVVAEGTADEVARSERILKNLALEEGINMDRGDDAENVWDSRFALTRATGRQRVALAGEVLMAPDMVPGLLDQVNKAADRPETVYECHVVDRDRALVLLGYVADPGAPGLARDVVMTVRVSALALRTGGLPYGIGLWNTCYSGSILGKAYRELKVIKHETDRLRVLNPGKLFGMTTGSGFPVPGWMYKSLVGLVRRFH
jgi:FAD/FMN-containing dehydrogenase